jgi:putative FmdB family regulatory protein
MKKVFEHRCLDCNVVSEHRVEWEDKIQTCPECGGDAKRIISAVAWGNENSCGVDGTWPGAAGKWERDTTRRHKNAGQSHAGTKSQQDGLLK